MVYIVVMVHRKVDEVVFSGLARIPGTGITVIKVEYQGHTRSQPDGKFNLEKAKQNITNAIKVQLIKDGYLQASNEEDLTKPIKNPFPSMDYFIVEANYADPGSSTINEELLKHILAQYPSSNIIATSTTIDAIVAALKLDPKMCVIYNNNNKIDDDIAIICSFFNLSDKDRSYIVPRVYTLPTLREELAQGKTRLRASTLPNASPPVGLRAARRNTVGDLLPMLSLRKAKDSEILQESCDHNEEDKMTSSMSKLSI